MRKLIGIVTILLTSMILCACGKTKWQGQMDAENLDGGIEYLFHFLDGEIVS